ncbi:Phosphate-repressible acid phosphatase [Alternaria tenuissima]|jgi:acid phosphatase|uniref:Phosphate-repressible acid phosphatase n=2 Tax=Alternaria alternata complex TaxID=187734 RepID=A0A4Q4NUM8_ALTAL|nr:phosphoesterase family-domain-containing protein [Alternaria alternata]RYN38490.1 Phosphate-repressible acid phosphatase [Alternaria tenuissima]OWY49094.1 phosphoesterase-like protein [Alternaria alternata]RYN47486.1 Phosphate-repressible acid phosphatase [Alternaria tenuissima]RYN83919.1 Phosphate-repressible acid phosphatase [Alternaria alternata]
MITPFVLSLALLANLSPVHAIVKGKAFDRIAIIWLENTDYDLAAGDPNLAWLAKKGISLTNYFAVTHPSMPNYAASISGDYYGINHDDMVAIPSNVSTLVDLLEDKGVSWGEYQEDMPSVGFQGKSYTNPKTGANMYVRKHNPAVLYDSVAQKTDRLAKTKPLTMFKQDMDKNQLPQWMFITPNMTSDGHDTTVTVAGTWTRKFLEPLLTNKNFMNNTLVMVTFDENHTYGKQNRVVSILLGDAVPANLVGTTDNAYYNHYSEISTVQANWGLHTLGRWDVGANVFKFVAAKTGDTVRAWSGKVPFSNMYFNASYAGKLSNKNTSVPWPVPNTNAVFAGRSVLPAIADTWGKQVGQSAYTTALEIPDGMHPEAEFK